MSPIEKPDPPASIDYHRNLQNHRHHNENQEHLQLQQQQQQQAFRHQLQHHRKQRQQYEYQFKLYNNKRRSGHKSVIDHHLTSLNNTGHHHNVITSSAISESGSQKLFNDHQIGSSVNSENDGDEESDDNNNNHKSFRICEKFNDINESNANNNENLNSINDDKEYLKDHLYETIDDDLPKCECNRQLFGIQLEVTSLLLEAERRKLAVLQRELQVALEDGGSIKKAKEQFKQELILAISRIQLQYDLLEKEYEHHAIGRLRSSNTRGVGKQILKDGCSTAYHSRASARLNQRTVTVSFSNPTNYTPTMSTAKTTISTVAATLPTLTTAAVSSTETKHHALPSSPNIVFGNDCCGMLLTNSSKNEKTHLRHQSQTAIVNNNNNNNPIHQHTNSQHTCGLSESGAGESMTPPALSTSSSLSMSCNKIVQSLNCTCNSSSEKQPHQPGINDGVDTTSSVSSCSGGFRDSVFLAKQAAYAAAVSNVANAAPQSSSMVESPKKYHNQPMKHQTTTPITTGISANQRLTSSNSNPNATNVSTQKLQFMQNSKQIDQMLAQRLSTSTITPALPNTGSTISTTKLTSTSLITDAPSLSSTLASATDAQGSSTTNAKKRMSTSSGGSTDIVIFHHQNLQKSNLDSTNAEQAALTLQFSKLQEEMKQQCKVIQDKHLIERRPAQQHYRPVSSEDSMSNRSQPAIGLKQTPKSRMDDEILKTVESMLGKDIKIVDCEKTSSVREEEVLLINGIPVQIEGEDGIAIKSALMTGQVPPCDLLNQLLYRAGILRQPVHLETSLSVKSSVIRKEEVTVAKNGKILNERTSETQENNIYTSSCNEIWEPVDELGALKTIIPIPVDQCLLSGEGNDCGDAFLLAAPKHFSPIPGLGARQRVPKSEKIIQNPPESQRQSNNSTSNVSRDLSKVSPIIPSTSVASSSSISSAASSTFNSNTGIGGLRSGGGGKSFSYIDCCSGSPPNALNSPLSGQASPIAIKTAKTRNVHRDGDCLKSESIKKLPNCMSFDSGHDDFFNSLSQSNLLSAMTGTCGSCSAAEDTNGTGTPTLHSNSISSCYDFMSSSDETDQHDKSISCSPTSITKDPSLSKMPTIFGTVASDQCPKDNVNRKGFPQTTTNSGSKPLDKIHNQPSSKHVTISLSSNVAVGQPQQQHPQNQARQNHDQQQHHYQSYLYRQQQQPSLDGEENALVYRDGNLISGPLDTLIQHMVPTSDYYPDRSYIFAFLLSARLFIRPHELLAKICHLCEEQQELNCNCCFPSGASNQGNGGDVVDHAYQKPVNSQLILDHQHHQQHHCHQRKCEEGGIGAGSKSSDSIEMECCRKLRAFAQNFVTLLTEWIDTFPYDFRDERLMQHVRSMTRKCISIDSSLRKEVQTMLQDLLQRLTVLEKYEEFLLSLAQTTNALDGPNNIVDMQSHEMIKNNAAASHTHSKPSVLTIQNNLHGNAGDKGGQTSAINSSGGMQQQLTTSSSASSASSILSTGSGGANLTVSDISQLCPSPTLLAHQLTHIELERLSYIGPEEFVQAFAKENPHLETSFSDMKKTRNLESYVQWFNRLSYLVATEIVKHPKKKQRVRIVEYWIETARECFNIGNFNSLMAIIAGLNMSPISRLKKTWSKVQSAKFLVLEHQMDPSSNFNSYRSTLKAAMWRSAGATDERERIVIPFFSLLVKDLYFLNEGCSNKLSNGHINFEKFWQLAKQVTEFIAWKQVTCPFEKLINVIMFLQTSSILNENKLAIASFECEPPENNHEKDRYKSLKTEQQNTQSQQQQLHHHHQQQHQ